MQVSHKSVTVPFLTFGEFSLANTVKGIVLVLPFIITACAATSPPAQTRMPTDAEVEQYNALVAPEDRIMCREEVNVGSNIPQRKCYLVRAFEESSRFHREQLRNVLR